MLKHFTKLGLMCTALSIGIGHTVVAQTVDLPLASISTTQLGSGVIEVISTDGQKWTEIKGSSLTFHVNVNISGGSGHVVGYKVSFANQKLAHQTFAPQTPAQFDENMSLQGTSAELPVPFADSIIAACNKQLSVGQGIHETHTLPYNALLQLTAWTANASGASNTPLHDDTHAYVPIKCIGSPKTVGPYAGSNDYSAPPVDFKVKDIDLFLSTFSGGNTSPNPATVCKKGRILVRLKASKAGPAKFKLWTKVGNGPLTSKDIDTWVSHDGNGGFEAEHIEWISVNKTMQVQAMAEEMVSAIGKTTQWKDITLPCTNPGGGGIATNPNPGNPDNPHADDLPQFKTLKGDFSFFDPGKARCTRTGKALLTFTSPKPDNVHYSLDCKYENHSGVVPVVPNPAGGYMAAKLVSFDIENTIDESCTLRTVAPYGPKDHVTKTHLFQCSSTVGHTASDDVQVPSIPPWDKPDTPATLVPAAPHNVVKSCPAHQKLIWTQVERHGILYDTTKCVDRDLKPVSTDEGPAEQHNAIVGAGSSSYPVPPWQCIGGSFKNNNCICRTGWKPVPWTVKDHGVKRHGKKCVPSGPGNKTTGTDVQSVDSLVVRPNSDAVDRRQQAAKKAEEARRKREQAAERARRLKAARDAAIAKRKRDAAIAKRKRDAELARARLKAKQQAARRAAQQLRRTNTVVKTAPVQRRMKVRKKKRSAPKRTGTATQMRMIRRR